MKRKAWHRREDETLKAYSAFKIFLELPPKDRSISGAWRKYAQKTGKDGKNKHYFDRWYKKHEWRERVTAYEEYVLGESLKEVAKYHKQIAIVSYKSLLKLLTRTFEESDEIELRDIPSHVRSIVSALKDLGIVVQQPETSDDSESKGLHIVLDVSEIDEG